MPELLADGGVITKTIPELAPVGARTVDVIGAVSTPVPVYGSVTTIKPVAVLWAGDVGLGVKTRTIPPMVCVVTAVIGTDPVYGRVNVV